MDKTIRPSAPESEIEPAGGPLSRLVDRTAEQPADELRNDLPTPPVASSTGRADYAAGTSEHDDDRDV
jgi:hypothetical protein